MNSKKQTIDALMDAFSNYLRSIHRSEGTIKRYRIKWKKVKGYMEDHHLKFYSQKVEKAYLRTVLGAYDYHQLDKKSRDLVNTIEALYQYQTSGRIMMGARKHPPKAFRGSASSSIKAFIAYRQQILKLSESTIGSYIFHLYAFCSYLNHHKIPLKTIKASQILVYIAQMNPHKPANRHVGLNILKNFFKYLYEEHILVVDYSGIIPKDNYKNQPKLPSTFTNAEITALLKAVDRGNPRGKRDYAILLLAIRLGLRASDICGLTFDNIHWESNIISLTQRKTQGVVQLPLLPEVGNAIVDYLKHGRPMSDDNHCFIHVQGPYEGIHPSDLGNLVHKYMTLAKINYANRKHGPHSLRHSFASALLREKIPLPIISEALGHTTMASTMEYLRIDMEALKQCALEVPLLSMDFYDRITEATERRVSS